MKEWLKPLKADFMEKQVCEDKWKQENCGSYTTLEAVMFADSLLMDEILAYFNMAGFFLFMSFLFVFFFFWY